MPRTGSVCRAQVPSERFLSLGQVVLSDGCSGQVLRIDRFLDSDAVCWMPRQGVARVQPTCDLQRMAWDLRRYLAGLPDARPVLTTMAGLGVYCESYGDDRPR